MLQTRNGKRTAAAALKIAVDLVDEGMITEKEAVLRVEPKQLDSLLHPQFDPAALKAAAVIGKGLAASPGAACGQVVFTADDAKEAVESGKMKKVVLVRLETSPEDIEGMAVAQGILTVRGGMTSHAAVVARGMGTCCVSGCGDIVVDYDNKMLHACRQDLSTRATGSPSTAPPATSTARPCPRWTPPSPATSAASWAGPTPRASWKCLPTRTTPATPSRPSSSARKASACAAPSICSLKPTASRLCAR